MPSGKNYNIVSKNTVLAKGATGSSVAIGSSVAAGLTRYVTYIRLQTNGSGKGLGSKVWFCSATAAASASSTALANTRAKLITYINSAYAGANPSLKVMEVPDKPDTENPLFTIAASKFLIVRQSKLQLGSASVSIFTQYYDQ